MIFGIFELTFVTSISSGDRPSFRQRGQIEDKSFLVNKDKEISRRQEVLEN